MFFDNIRLYLDDPNTGRLKIRYVCKECGKEVDKPKYWRCHSSYGGVPKYHEAEFICIDCEEKTT